MSKKKIIIITTIIAISTITALALLVKTKSKHPDNTSKE